MSLLKKLLIWFFGLLLLLISGSLVFLYTVDFAPTEQEIQQAFQKIEYSPRHHFLEFDNRKIHYVAVGDTNKPILFLIHGSPGSWNAFLSYLSDPELLEAFRIIAPDRPGFGRSGKGQPVASLQKQAFILSAILHQENNNRDIILAGHSYGCPLAIKMLILDPDIADAVVLISPSVDPELEEIKWFQRLARNELISSIIPSDFYASNEEIWPLKADLTQMADEWNRIKVPVSIIHGGKDRLVPVENASFAYSKLLHTKVNKVIEPSMNHFIPWNHPEVVKKEIYRLNRFLNTH